MKLELLLKIGGALHFAILLASSLAPTALNWRVNLCVLPPLLRRMFWVYGGFIVLVIVSFGTLTLAHSRSMADGEPVARALCAFIAVFWLARLGVQCFVFDAKAYLTNWFLKTGYHWLTVVFIYFTLVFGWAALFGASGINFCGN